MIYAQSFGGGGAGLGLLLGPLGVAANVKMIETVTNADVALLKGKLALDPKAAFRSAAATTNLPLAANDPASGVRVTPFVYVSKTTEQVIHVSAVLLFEATDAQGKWLRRYQHQLPGQYTLQQLATLPPSELARIQSASSDAFAALIRYAGSETRERLPSEPRITFRSEYVSPRFDFEFPGTLIAERDGMVWLRTPFAVLAINKSDVKVQPVKN